MIATMIIGITNCGVVAETKYAIDPPTIVAMTARIEKLFTAIDPQGVNIFMNTAYSGSFINNVLCIQKLYEKT